MRLIFLSNVPNRFSLNKEFKKPYLEYYIMSITILLKLRL